ncbi:MAG: hypothetical protein ACI9QD_000287 [Thermoproteota archaeon]|jgi:hypothetical protein
MFFLKLLRFEALYQTFYQTISVCSSYIKITLFNYLVLHGSLKILLYLYDKTYEKFPNND